MRAVWPHAQPSQCPMFCATHDAQPRASLPLAYRRCLAFSLASTSTSLPLALLSLPFPSLHIAAGLPPPPPSRRRQSTPADPGVCCPPSRLAARCWPRPLISLRLRSLIAATPLTVFPVRTLTILVVADVFSDLPLRSSHPFCNWYRIALAAILRFILRRLVGSLARSPR